jgi:hypothetical protein
VANDQSSSSSEPVPTNPMSEDCALNLDTTPPIPNTRRKRSTARKNMGSLESSRHLLAPYDRGTIARGKSWAKAKAYNAKCDEENRPQAQSAAKTTKQQKCNDFGGGTFWNRPTTSRRDTSTSSHALSTTVTPSPPHHLIVDTGASHVLFKEQHMDLLTHV